MTGSALGAEVSPHQDMNHAVESPAVDGERSLQESEPVTNNTSVRHRNPSIVSSEGQLDELRGVLEARLTSRLERGVVQISQGQYDRAEEVLGKEFLSTLDKYGEVAGQSSDGSGDTVERLNRTRNQQIEYAESVSEFTETYEAYREAREEGNETRARQLGRELVNVGENVSRQAERLNRSYSELRTVSAVNLDVARDRVRTTQSQIDTTTEEVIESEFVTTRLVVRETEARGSFTDPLRVEASISNRSNPIGGRTINLTMGAQKYTVTTDADGGFVIDYRPTAVFLNNSMIDLQYVPANSSTYLGSNASVPVTLEGVTGEATVDVRTSETAFGAPFAVGGNVTVGDQPVPELPLAVVVDGKQLGTVRTDQDGEFEFSTNLSATPGSGTQTVVVSPTAPGRAVDVPPVNGTVTVRETATSLSAFLTETNTTVRITGRLTANGSSLPGKQVSVAMSEDPIRTVRTDANGSYTIRFDNGELSGDVAVRFDATGTNLESAEASVDVPIKQDNESGVEDVSASDAPQSVQEWTDEVFEFLRENQLLVGGVVSGFFSEALFSPVTLIFAGAVTGAGGALLVAISRRRRNTAKITDSGSSLAGPRDEEESDDRSRGPSTRTSSLDDVLESGDPDRAVIEAYGVVRAALVDAQQTRRPQTHWQFFETCVADGVEAANLRTLTEAYERAQYGSEVLEPAVAWEAVSAAGALLEPSEAGPRKNVPESVRQSEG